LGNLLINDEQEQEIELDDGSSESSEESAEFVV